MPVEPPSPNEWDDLRAAGAGTRFADTRLVAETGSTNADVLGLARDGAPEGIVLLADHQTAGRGRLDRRWEAPPGSSLLVSILTRPHLHGITDDHLHLCIRSHEVEQAIGETLGKMGYTQETDGWGCTSTPYTTGCSRRRLARACASVYSGAPPSRSASRSCRCPLSGSMTPRRSQVGRVA